MKRTIEIVALNSECYSLRMLLGDEFIIDRSFNKDITLGVAVTTLLNSAAAKVVAIVYGKDS